MRAAWRCGQAPPRDGPRAEGGILHWTRPFDVLLMRLALPSALILSSNRAIELAGMVVSPLLQLAAALLFVWALRPVIRPQTWSLPAVALFLQPSARWS